MHSADNHSGMIMGLAASPGIALGPAHLMHDAGGILVPRRTVEDKMNGIQQMFVVERLGEEGCRPLG